MTKEITKAFILQQIQSKFKLRELVPEKFTFQESVIPIYNIESHLMKREIEMLSLSITSADSYTFFTVPETERWILSEYNVIFMATGAYKVTGVYIVRALSTQPDRFMYLDMLKGQTASYTVLLPQSVIIDPGDTLSILVDDYTSTASLRLYIDVTKEEIR